MGDWDMVQAVTQGSLNSALRGQWTAANKCFRTLRAQGKKTWQSKEYEIQTCAAEYSFVHEKHGEEVFFAATPASLFVKYDISL